jgi:hypothetical protein
MKEPNLPENQLRGWRPRRPSAGLKERLFPPPAENQAPFWGLTRLAPALACLFFVMMALHFNDGGLWSRPRLMPSATNSGDIYGGQASQNHLASVTFDWTNHSNFQSSIPFASKTNSSN